MSITSDTTQALASLHEQFISEQRFSLRLSPATLRGYRQTFAAFLSLMPTMRTSQVTASAMTEFFRRLDTRIRFAGRQQRRGVKTSTVATYRSKLNRFCEWLKSRGELAANPFDQMSYPRVEYEDRKYLGRRDVERIFSALVLGGPWQRQFLRKRNLAIFALLLYTGMR